MDFDGNYSVVNLGFDSKWWPGSTEEPGGSPIQVRVGAIGAAKADAHFNGDMALTAKNLKLGPGAGEWGYDFGAAVFMKVAINLSFTIPNPLPFGDDLKLGPWVIDLPYVPDFDLLNSKRTTVNSWLLDESSTLTDETEPISVYDLSLIEYLIGGIDIPDWAMTILQLDAGASLNVAIGTTAVLSGDSIALSDGTSFTAEGQTKTVAASPPTYSVNADYNENLNWDLELFFKPTVFLKILGQRYDLPVITIPWKAISGLRDLAFNTNTLNFSVANPPQEGEVEGTPEGNPEGAPEGTVEGDDGEFEFPTGCAYPCETACDSTGVNLDSAASLSSIYGTLGIQTGTADRDSNGIKDYAQFMLLDSIVANPDAQAHCCVLSAWQSNYIAVEAMAGFSGDRPITTLQARYLTVLASLATLGEPATYELLLTLAANQGWNIDTQQLDPSAGIWLGSQGDADLDTVCNYGENAAGNGDMVNFVIAAQSPEIVLGAASCEVNCGAPVEGEPSEGEVEQRWTLQVVETGAGQGDVLVAPAQADYATGEVVTLSVFAGPNSIFAGFSGTAVQQVEGTNQYIVVVTGNLTLQATFNLLPDPEGETEGTPVEGEGILEGEDEGELPAPRSSADINGDGEIGLQELLRLIQIYNHGIYWCDANEEDGYSLAQPVEGEAAAHDCPFHTSDYSPADWRISLTELLRLVQFYNLGGYIFCNGGEDGFCVITP